MRFLLTQIFQLTLACVLLAPALSQAQDGGCEKVLDKDKQVIWQAKKKSSFVTACRPATASIFAKLSQRATPTPATECPVAALIAWHKCVTSSAGAKSFLRAC